MKQLNYILLLLLVFQGCIRIENDPLVTVTPSIEFQGHIRNDEVHVTATIRANPTFVDPGNIPVIIYYEGTIDLYNTVSGELLTSEPITGKGLTSIVVAIASAKDFEDIIIIASGTVSAYADKESDGDPSNDLFLHSSDFYQELSVADIISIVPYPVVTMQPAVEFQTYIRSSELYTTATVTVNPDYVLTGESSILFKHEGVLQIYDVVSGALLKSSSMAGNGLSNAVTILADTSSFDGFIIIASGVITCSEDVENDSNTSNDRFISSADFYEVLEVDLRE
ncbi:MAG: hypothetical protein ACOYXB_09715 [Bacteroidota bacterium]